MGLSKSKEGNKDLALFSPEEQELLQRNVAGFADGSKALDSQALKKRLLTLVSAVHGIEEVFTRLCNLMSKSTDLVTFDGYIHIAAIMLKGMTEEKSEVIVYLSSGHKHHTSLQDITKFTKLLLISFVNIARSGKPFQSWALPDQDELKQDSIDRLAASLSNDLSFQGVPTREIIGETISPDSKYDVASVNVWYNKCHLVAEVFDIFARQVFCLPLGSTIPLIPFCRGIPADVYPSWLTVGDLLLINTSLPAELRDEWRFLFSTRIHGESFSSLMGNIIDKGPTVIIIKDDKGHAFGGFASTSWTLSPSFTGTEKDFVFSLYPRMAVYMATGFNNHFKYMNIQQQTFPNGLGMGGQLNYFGFWIDAEFGQGSCAPSCTTYGCPQLSADPEFKIDRLEVWGVGPEPTKEDEENEPRPSILDADMEGVAILRMISRGPVSEGLRESPTADSPTEKELPPLDLMY